MKPKFPGIEKEEIFSFSPYQTCVCDPHRTFFRNIHQVVWFAFGGSHLYRH